MGRSSNHNIGDQKFNDDLLLCLPDRELAEQLYPSVLHVLDRPELRNYFASIDRPANRAKSSGRKFGFLAIALGSLALAAAAAEHLLAAAAAEHPLAVAAAEHLVVSDQRRNWPAMVFALFAAFAGILSAVFGSQGLLFAGKKREWLHLRFKTERIRQFHFQTFVARLPEIYRSLDSFEARLNYETQWNLWFRNLKHQLDEKLISEYTNVLDEEHRSEFWLHEFEEYDSNFQDREDLVCLFEAYRNLRIKHQLGYANYKLAGDHRILSGSPRRQSSVLSAVAFGCIVLLGIIHFLIVLAVPASLFFKAEDASEVVISGIVSVVTIWIAILALGVRALEEGLQPEREIERYQQYRSTVRAILDRFEASSSQADKIKIMREMERAAFDEMRNFLQSNERSKFVI